VIFDLLKTLLPGTAHAPEERTATQQAWVN